MNRSDYSRTAGHPPLNCVPLRAGYNPNATPTQDVAGFGRDARRMPSPKQQDWQVERFIQSVNEV